MKHVKNENKKNPDKTKQKTAKTKVIINNVKSKSIYKLTNRANTKRKC